MRLPRAALAWRQKGGMPMVTCLVIRLILAIVELAVKTAVLATDFVRLRRNTSEKTDPGA